MRILKLFSIALVLGEEHEPDLEPKALWSHGVNGDGKKELHCLDRELIHPCTTELKKYLIDKDESYKQHAYDCAKTVYETKQEDFWIMKNMTHLLLDLDTNDHNFDQGERDNDFYQLGLDFGHKLIENKECMAEFDDKDPLECRCPMLYAKILLLKYKNANRWEDAETFYRELKEFEWKGEKRQFAAGEAFPWQSIKQTPQIWLNNLETKPIWGEERRKDLPIWDVLENNYETIKEETLNAFETEYVEDAYRFLYKGGDWNQILLFHGREYTEACEKAFPKTCAILKEALPKREVHHYPWTSNQNEQVVILKMTKGTEVETHCGPANNILNVHLGIVGTEGAELIVEDEKAGWQDGKVIPWDGSYDHSVNCVNCKQDRIVMMVRYMHPDVTKEHYRGNSQTHFEPVPEDWFKEEIVS